MPDSIHSGHRERIREHYKTHGAEAFLDHQFLELLLTYAIPRKDTNELAHLLLTRFGSLEGVVTAEIPQLMLVEVPSPRCEDNLGEGFVGFICWGAHQVLWC